MDYCPEVAVLQSAFQLVNKQAGDALADISKEKCDLYVKVIVSTVEEICSGLEYDLDLETRELWQQKLHCLLFYTLVKNSYIKEEEVVTVTGRVPIHSPLDMLSVLLPSFSSAFFFELIKQCGWTSNFLQCLQCLDTKTSSSLLCDLLSHCEQTPVTDVDRNVMDVLSEKLLARCLCVPDMPAVLCQDLLKPLNRPRKFVTVIYPDNDGEFVDDKVKDTCLTGTKQKVGVQMFDEFVKNKSDILNLILSNFEKRIDLASEMLEQVVDEDMVQILIQLEFWYYLLTTGKDNSSVDWFVNNVFLPDEYNQSKVDHSENPDTHTYLAYSLNFVLIEYLCHHGNLVKFKQLIEKCVRELFKNGGKKRSSNSNTHHTVQIVSGLSATKTVLLRMLYGIMGTDHTQEQYSHLEEIFNVSTSADGEEVLLAESWNADITLDALLWRITQRLPPYQVCIDRLLEDKCLQFWTSQRLPHRMLQCTTLLSRADRVSNMSNILTALSKSSQARETTTSIINLIQTTFLQLPFPDKDQLVKEWYCSESHYLSDVLHEGLQDRVTNTLNKVTADLNNQVLDEILLLFIGDPLYVLNSILMLSIDNEQQANSCCQIIRLVYKTCRSCHPIHHPDTSLVAYCIQNFLTSQSLTSKQQKHFLVFVTELMTTRPKSSLNISDTDFVLSPSEFILTIVLPSLSAENLDSPTGRISFEFAINLLLSALTCSREVIQDDDNHSALTSNGEKTQNDYKQNVEVMSLLVLLAEIQHKCLVCWEVVNITQPVNVNDESVSMNSESRPKVTMATKLNIRERINECYSVIVHLIERRHFEVQQCDVVWFLGMTAEFHLMVKYGLCELMDTCGCHEYREAWEVAMVTCLDDVVANLVTILQFVAVDASCIKTILEILQDVTISCDHLITSLIQVLPLCTSTGFVNVWTFIEELITSDSFDVVMMYKLQSTCYIPLLDYTVLRPHLYLSQLLMYTMMMLASSLKQTPQQEWSMLQPVITSYVAFLKVKCEQFSSDNDAMLLIYLCELFHHVGEVSTYLTVELMDVTLILMLQILTQYVSVCEHEQDDSISDSSLKLRITLENGLFHVIQRLPGNSDAKDMLRKKLRE